MTPCAGRLGESGHQSHPGDSRACHHAQPARQRFAFGHEHVESAHEVGDRGRPGWVHVPAEHGSHEEPGIRCHIHYIHYSN